MLAQDSDEPSVPSQTATTNMANAQQPIRDSVTTAFDKSDVQDLDPKLVAQITENVIKQLRQVNLEPAPAAPSSSKPSSSQAASPRPATAHAYPRPAENLTSPPLDPADSSPLKHTTGLQPEKHTEYASSSQVDVRSTRSASDGACSPSGTKESTKAAEQLDETPLERIWGRLFDGQGTPTPRLNQVLRGLALHLVEDYEPKNSLVISPSKMLKYYRETKLEAEYYPWKLIFDDEETYISRMFRDLGCEHHLVQESVFERPEIPGLTPKGFATWMTLMLLAHPDEEFERLRFSVVNMPVSNADDRKERFPKDISRRLFPSSMHIKSRNDLRRTIRKHSRNAKIDPPNDEEQSPNKSINRPGSDLGGSFYSTGDSAARGPGSDNGSTGGVPVQNANNITVPPFERERQPYRASTGQAPGVPLPGEKIPTVGPAGETAILDDDHPIAPKPIERERAPYYSKPGGGKNYEEPAGSRNVYPLNPSAAESSSTFTLGSVPSTLPPRQGSVEPPPAPNNGGLTRSNSGNKSRGRPAVGINTNGGGERGPPPAPSAGTANPGPEVHQVPPPPPQGRTRNGSFTRRRAPSTGRAYYGDARAGAEDTRTSATPYSAGGYDPYRPPYVERGGGHDGYGPPEEDYYLRGPRGNSIQNGGAARAVSNGPDDTPYGRRDSPPRSRGSPGKQDASAIKDTSGRRGSWMSGANDYRDPSRF